MKISLRNMKLHDIKQLMELNQKTLPENYDREFWVEKFHEGKIHSFVAIFAGQIIGYVFCDNDTIISLAIDEKFRNKGLGKQLLGNCLNTYNINVRLHVRVTNNIALKLYESFGFSEEQKLIDYYVDPIEDAYVMIWKPSGTKYDVKRKLNINANAN